MVAIQDRFNFSELIKEFQVPGQLTEAIPYGTGHINDTFLLTTETAKKEMRYILQRINHRVFVDPPALIDNIQRVTDHIRRKLGNHQDIHRRVLQLIPTTKGSFLLHDQDGDFWRLYFYIEGARTYDILNNTEQIYAAAHAFGAFLEQLNDFSGPPLKKTIPGFHNGPKRYAEFQRILDKDAVNRAAQAKEEIAFLQNHADIFSTVSTLIETGKLPTRISHNDTKINNVMIDDQTGEGICVIDLDTVMSGNALYDFGDIVRTSVTACAEDRSTSDKPVEVDLKRFRAMTQGYLTAAGASLNETEISHLVTGGKLMPLIIGMRFLSDFLDGDHYFKTSRQKQNLDRCRNQFDLVRSILDHEDDMNEIVRQVKKERGL